MMSGSEGLELQSHYDCNFMTNLIETIVAALRSKTTNAAAAASTATIIIITTTTTATTATTTAEQVCLRYMANR